ncbi:hypothetical protein REPUB_Repub08aG0097600 [Reevesia pubescens]
MPMKAQAPNSKPDTSEGPQGAYGVEASKGFFHLCDCQAKENSICKDILDRVKKIYKVFPQILVPSNLVVDDDVQQLTEAFGVAKTCVKGCSSFLRAAIKWFAEFGAHRNGDPQLHAMLAKYIYFESPELDMARVLYNFVRGNNPKKFASTLVNFMSKCYLGEDDIAIARAILMYLSMGNL